jgi:N4-gp56 family major capsid protein
MAVTTAVSLAADVSRFLAEDLLELTHSDLVFDDFAEKLTLPPGSGTTYTMTRYARLPVSYAPTAEGVPPVATPLQISQSTVALQQWTALVTITDVSTRIIKHHVFEIAKDRLRMSASELLDRNAAVTLFGFTQVNYVNSKGGRGNILASDVMNPQELQRASSMLQTLGAPMFRGPQGPLVKKSAKEGQPQALSEPRTLPHWIAILHPFMMEDLRNNPQIQLDSFYSGNHRLYNMEVGQWSGIRFCSSNMVPFFVGIPIATGAGAITGGSLATGNYQIIITGSDNIFQYETLISQQSASINVASGAIGSVNVTVPSTPGYTYSVYISAVGSTVVQNLATSVSGPTQGPLQGMATQLAPGSAVVLTGVGAAKVPPAAPANGVTVYPMFLFGEHAFARVTLDEIEVNYLDTAEKTDPANQLRMASYKFYNGYFLKNNAFAIRIEGSSAGNLTFN